MLTLLTISLLYNESGISILVFLNFSLFVFFLIIRVGWSNMFVLAVLARYNLPITYETKKCSERELIKSEIKTMNKSLTPPRSPTRSMKVYIDRSCSITSFDNV